MRLYLFLRFIFVYLFVCMCVWCVHTSVSGAQKRESEPPELMFPVAVSCQMWMLSHCSCTTMRFKELELKIRFVSPT